MRILVHEHVTGGGLAGAPLTPSLKREGWAMLRSIVEDFSRVNEVESVVATLDARLEGRLGGIESDRAEAVPVGEGETESTLRRLAGSCDAMLVIAPELDGVLLERTLWSERHSPRILGSSSAAVALAGDKLALAGRLAALGVPTVPLVSLDLHDAPDRSFTSELFPAVLKPRHGAGSQWTYLVEEPGELPETLAAAKREGAPREMVIGPQAKGIAASASFLCGPGEPVPLLAGAQMLSTDGRFRYLGGRLPLPADLSARAISLAARAVAAVPGVRGFAGVDLVLEAVPAQGSPPRDTVIEINPRLTTSYVGLRVLARRNLAELWLAAVSGVDGRSPEWYGDGVGFFPDGSWFREVREKI
jgi:hypothetical protein